MPFRYSNSKLPDFLSNILSIPLRYSGRRALYLSTSNNLSKTHYSNNKNLVLSAPIIFWCGGLSFCLVCFVPWRIWRAECPVAGWGKVRGRCLAAVMMILMVMSSLLSLHYAGVERPNLHPHYQQNTSSLSLSLSLSLLLSPDTGSVCWYKILLFSHSWAASGLIFS